MYIYEYHSTHDTNLLTTLNIGTFEDILKTLDHVTSNPEERPVFV